MATKAQEWTLAAFEWGKKAQAWFIVGAGSPEEIEWEKYFQKLGFVPWAFKRLVRNEVAEWTAPCRWPEWFPADWADQAKEMPNLRLIEGKKA